MSGKKQTIIVIGAGIGGIVTAARLAQKGHTVTVYEKNSGPGGRCGQFQKDGFVFDSGATIFLMPDIYRKTFIDLGTRMEDHLELRRTDPTYQIHFADQSPLFLTSDLQRMQQQAEAMEPGSSIRMLRYLEQAGEIYRLALPHLVEKDFLSLAEFLNPANLLLFARLKPFLAHHRFAERFFRDPRMQIAFTFHDMYMGLSPFDAPATYSIMQYNELAHGMWYPKGGMFRVTEVLTKIAETSGVRFEYNAPVTSIRVRKGRAIGVALEDGEVPADIVVANADLGYVYRTLLPNDGTAARLDRMEYGCSAVMFYWGLDTQLSGLSSHNLFFSGDYRKNFHAVCHGTSMDDQPNFYLHLPRHMDADMAPEGCETAIVAMPVANLREGVQQDWKAVRDYAREFVIRKLAENGAPDIRQHIRVEEVSDPVDLQGRFNLTRGSTHGLNHGLMQMAYFRPGKRHHRYANLYFVGASTHPGTGVPMVLISARMAAERIIQDQVSASQRVI